MAHSKKGFFLGISLAALAILWRTQELNLKTSVTPAAPARRPQSMPELLAKSLPLPRSSVSQTAEEAVCRKQWEEIALIDVAAFGTASSEPGLINLENVWGLLAEISRIQTSHPCSPGVSSPLGKYSQVMSKWCRTAQTVGPEKAAEIGDEPDTPRVFGEGLMRSSPLDKCLSHFEMLRQDMAELATQGLELSAIASVAVLANKFYALGRHTPPDLKQLGAILDRIRQIEPGDRSATLMATQVEYARWRSEHSASDALESLNVSPETGEFQMALYKLQYKMEREDFEFVQSFAERLLVADHHTNLANYYLAQVAYQSGDIELAKQYLGAVAKGKWADYKDKAFIAKKRLETEDFSQPPSVPLFPAPGVTLYTSFQFPLHTPGEPVRMALGGDTGITLASDEFSDLVIDRYRNYWDQAMGLPTP